MKYFKTYSTFINEASKPLTDATTKPHMSHYDYRDNAEAIKKLYDLADMNLTESKLREIIRNEISSLNEAKTEKEHTIIITRNNKDRETSGTLAELVDYFGNTLESGKSYQHEKGNRKINTNPKSIKSLIQNINNAKSNSAANGNSSTSYSLK
jgi:transposase-like protein